MFLAESFQTPDGFVCIDDAEVMPHTLASGQVFPDSRGQILANSRCARHCVHFLSSEERMTIPVMEAWKGGPSEYVNI